MKLNGAHQLLAYADHVNILGGSIHTVEENAEALVAATREIGLEVSADKTKYTVILDFVPVKDFVTLSLKLAAHTVHVSS